MLPSLWPCSLPCGRQCGSSRFFPLVFARRHFHDQEETQSRCGKCVAGSKLQARAPSHLRLETPFLFRALLRRARLLCTPLVQIHSMAQEFFKLMGKQFMGVPEVSSSVLTVNRGASAAGSAPP